MYLERPCEQKPLNYLGEKVAWAYPGIANFFEYPILSHGIGKATNFKFCAHVLSMDRNKRQLQISGKVAVG